MLPPGEKMVAMFQHPELVESVIVVDDLDHSHATSSSCRMSHTVDGVTLVTTSGVFKCRPKMSPEKLFLELAVNSADTSAADVLAITTGLDVNKLYEVCASLYVPVIVLWNYLQIDFKRHHHVARVGYCYQVSAVTVSVNVVSLVGHGKPL